MFERWRRVLFGGIAAGVALGAGCSDEPTRPPLVPDCNDPACIAARANGIPPRVGTGVPGGGDGAAGGAGGGSGMPGAGIVLAGNVRQATQLDLVPGGNDTTAISGTVLVRAENVVDNEDPVSGETDLGGPYRLEDVRSAPTVWVAVGDFENAAADSQYMDTLQGIDPTRSPDDLVVVPRSLLVDLAAAAFTDGAVELDPNAAHVVVRFVDPTGASIPDVALINPTGTPASIAYDAGVGVYSDIFDATDARGVAVIVNYPTLAYPGAALQLVASLNTNQYRVDIQVAADAVTVVTAVITEP
jgi:hypothetical protein